MRNYKSPARIAADLTGEMFGRLKVVRLLGSHEQALYWECVCECGSVVEKRTAALRSGNTISCGCSKIDRIRAMNACRVTHGQSGTRAYVAWSNMMRRAYDPSDTHYKRYGGRGIVVEAKFHDFDVFLEYMGDCPDGLTLEREDNNVGYVTGNILWATQHAQRRNKSTNVIVDLNGRKLIATDAAKELGMSVGKFLSRYHKGMSLSEITCIPHNTKVPVMFNGKVTALAQVCKDCGLPYQRIWARVNRQGLTVEEAIRRG